MLRTGFDGRRIGATALAIVMVVAMVSMGAVGGAVADQHADDDGVDIEFTIEDDTPQPGDTVTGEVSIELDEADGPFLGIEFNQSVADLSVDEEPGAPIAGPNDDNDEIGIGWGEGTEFTATFEMTLDEDDAIGTAYAIGGFVTIGEDELDLPERVVTVSETQDATFEVTDLDAPADVIEGSDGTVEATVTNVGDVNGTDDVEFRLAGPDESLDADAVVDTEENVSLAAGENETVAFDVAFDRDPGAYEHGVFTSDDSRSASVTISPEPEGAADYADEETGTVEITGLTQAFSDFQTGAVDPRVLADVFAAWQSEEPVTDAENASVTLDNVGSSAWEITDIDGVDGDDVTDEENPTLSFTEGERIVIQNDGGADAHPLAIVDDEGEELLSQDGEGALEDDEAIDFATDDDAIAFTVTEELADDADAYVCTVHGSMEGDLEFSD